MNNLRDAVQRYFSAKEQASGFHRQMERSEHTLREYFGRQLADLVMEGNMIGFFNALPCYGNNVEHIQSLQGVHDDELCRIALNSTNSKKAFFILLSLNRHEALQVARTMEQADIDEMLRLFPYSHVDDFVLSLPSHEEQKSALLLFPNSYPDLPDDFFHALSFDELDRLAPGFDKAGVEILARANGERLQEGQTPEDYWILAAQHSPLESAEDFFRMKLAEMEREGEESMALRSSIVVLAVRSVQARGWLESIGFEGIRKDPDFLIDVIVQSKGQECLNAARTAVEHVERMSVDDSHRILEGTDFNDVHSVAALLHVYPKLSVRRSRLSKGLRYILNGPHQKGAARTRRNIGVALAHEFYRRFHPSTVLAEVAHLPCMGAVLDGEIEKAFGKSTKPKEKRETYDSIFRAGGKYRMLAAAWSRNWYGQNGGDFSRIWEPFWTLSSIDRLWVIDGMKKYVLKDDATRRQGLLFIIATKTGTCFQKELAGFQSEAAKMGKHGKMNDMVADCAIASDFISMEDKDTQSSEALRLPPRTRPAFCEALCCASGKYAVLGDGIRDFSATQYPLALARAYGSLSDDEKEWVESTVRTQLICSEDETMLSAGLNLICAANLPARFEPELRMIAKSDSAPVKHWSLRERASAALFQIDESVFESEFKETEKDHNKFEGMCRMLNMAGGKFRVLGGIIGRLEVRAEMSMSETVGEFGDLNDEEKTWVLAQVRNHLLPSTNVGSVILSQLLRVRMDEERLQKAMWFIVNAELVEDFSAELDLIARAGLYERCGFYARGILYPSEIVQNYPNYLTSLVEGRIWEGNAGLYAAGGKHRVLLAAWDRNAFKSFGGDYPEIVHSYHSLDEGDMAWIDGSIAGILRTNPELIQPYTVGCTLRFIASAGIGAKFRTGLTAIAQTSHGMNGRLAAGILQEEMRSVGELVSMDYANNFAHPEHPEDLMALYNAGGRFRTLLGIYDPDKIWEYGAESMRGPRFEELPEKDQDWICNMLEKYLNTYFDLWTGKIKRTLPDEATAQDGESIVAADVRGAIDEQKTRSLARVRTFHDEDKILGNVCASIEQRNPSLRLRYLLQKFIDSEVTQDDFKYRPKQLTGTDFARGPLLAPKPIRELMERRLIPDWLYI